MRALKDSGYDYQAMPIARNTRSIQGMPACETTGTCDYCPIGARFTGDQPLDRLARSSEFTLHLEAPVCTLVMDKRSRVAAVEYVDRKRGEVRRIEAEWFFICSGALEAPKLLLASTSTYWPQGIGNDHDLVGRFLTASPFVYANGMIPTNPRRLQAELSFPTLCSRQWDSPLYQRQGKMLVAVNYNLPSVNLGKRMNAHATRAEVDAATIGQMHYQLWGSLQGANHFENRVEPASGETRFGLPRTKISTPIVEFDPAVAVAHQARLGDLLRVMGAQDVSAGGYPQRGDHAMGTTRMSRSDADGVTDDRLRVHGVDNLFVASNAVFPSAGAANPTLTLVALILRALEAFC
jgi:choline dehydrogenase-like flavoprotein